MAKFALVLGGFDKVRKLTLLQSRLLSKVLADERKFQIRLHGGTVEEQEEVEAQSFSDVFKNMTGRE